MRVLPQLRFLGWESRAILSACFVAPRAFIFLALIIYHFYCRYPPPIRCNERDPGHGAVTAESKRGESRSSRAVRSPPGRVSRLFSHPGGRGAQGFPPHSPPLLTFLWPGGERALPGARPALPAAAKFPGAGAASASPGGLGCPGPAGDVPASLGREGAGGSPPSFGGFFPR